MAPGAPTGGPPPATPPAPGGRRPGVVSFVLSTHNHARWVEQALDSVAAQTYPDLELVVVDDASQDDTVDVVRRWDERHRRIDVLLAGRRNLGVCRRLNEALDAATGEYVTFMAGDDWMEPDCVARQVARLAAEPPDTALVYCDARRVDEQGAPREEESHLRHVLGPTAAPPEGDLLLPLLRANFLALHAVLLRRSAIDAVGGFDESLAFEDWDMWLRLAAAGYRFAHQPAMLVTYRIHPASAWSTRSAPTHESIVRLLDRQCTTGATRRAAAPMMFIAAKSLYVSGADPAAARVALRRAFRARPRLEAAVFLALATARIPYSVVARVKGAVTPRRAARA